MKLSILAIALLAFIGVQAATTEMKGTDLQGLLAKQKNTFIILFYDPNADLTDGGKEDYVDQIQKKILGRPSEFKDYRFFTLDATDKDAEAFVEEAHIDLEKLKHHPIVAAYRNKDLVWYYGEGAVDELVKVLHTFTHEDGYQTQK